ncbi:hypothetical protein RIF29_16213 [Crotalaria pallida]|uniref:Uncharacterized protein n=1 Tax=Crotalaria pallida TaxID=3830 RepID=A0AAN9FGV2_CROPI
MPSNVVLTVILSSHWSSSHHNRKTPRQKPCSHSTWLLFFDPVAVVELTPIKGRLRNPRHNQPLLTSITTCRRRERERTESVTNGFEFDKCIVVTNLSSQPLVSVTSSTNDSTTARCPTAPCRIFHLSQCKFKEQREERDIPITV